MDLYRLSLSRRRLLVGLAVAPATVLLGTSCGSTSRFSVFAASSLTEAFGDISSQFESEVGSRPEGNFAASSVLATQILEGASADVFVSADEAQMVRLADAGLVGVPKAIAKNAPAVIASEGAAVEEFADLARPGLRLVLAGPAVPIGRYARQVLEQAAADPFYGPGFRDGVLANVRSEELSARAVLAKVELGEADAGIVFSTDALVAAAGVVTVVIPSEISVQAVYPAAVLNRSAKGAVADVFVEYLLSDEGQGLLAARGFESVLDDGS